MEGTQGTEGTEGTWQGARGPLRNPGTRLESAVSFVTPCISVYLYIYVQICPCSIEIWNVFLERLQRTAGTMTEGSDP